MDYEFKKNTLDGTYHANFSMGHEAMGRWLVEDVAKDTELLADLYQQIAAVKNTQDEWKRSGQVMTLILTDQEVIVQENALFENSEEEFEEDIHMYDDECISVCGLEDFEIMLQSWEAFIRRF